MLRHNCGVACHALFSTPKVHLVQLCASSSSTSRCQKSICPQLTTVSTYCLQPLHFVWVDARRQADFGAAFGLRPGDAPTVLMLSPRCDPGLAATRVSG